MTLAPVQIPNLSPAVKPVTALFPQNREMRQLSKRAIAVILAGGRGSRLKDLTDHRAKPAVHFGGNFRIIDFALSNCVNSGFRRISVLTQYKSHSLMRHMQHGWNFLRAEMGEFVDLIPAQQRVDENQWYQGTADAVFQNLDILASHKAEWILILAGDHVYKMDYAAMLAEHVRSGADITIPCVEVPRMEATGFGVMAVDADDRITGFLEKPADPPGIPGKPEMALASMGIYVFNTKFLYDQLRRDAADPNSSHDFGKDIIPYLVPFAKVMAHRFSDSCVRSNPDAPAYWRDVGTLDSYWEANIDLTRVTPELDLYDEDWPIFSYREQLPPAKFVFDQARRRGAAIDSIVSSGCIISGSIVRRSLLFNRVRVHSFCTIKDAVLLPDVVVGRNARLKRVVVDRGCEIPEGLVVGEDAVEDARRFYRSEKGIVLITSDMLRALQA
jgi:glucose-1-phosphate adenylyltransferase